MGSNYCCFQFRIPDELNDSQSDNNPLILGRILNTTRLEGKDYITFFEGESMEMIVNLYI